MPVKSDLFRADWIDWFHFVKMAGNVRKIGDGNDTKPESVRSNAVVSPQLTYMRCLFISVSILAARCGRSSILAMSISLCRQSWRAKHST